MKTPEDPAAPLSAAEPVSPCTEGMLAATLALMTGYAEHCSRPPAAGADPDLPRLLAAKAASNLFLLAGHTSLSVPLRATLWQLRSHWQALEHGGRAQAGVKPCCVASRAAAAWPPISTTRH